jgi:hypothetical protein
MSMEDIEKRLNALEGVEAIKRLKARYSAYCDDNYNPDKLATLFAEDAVWDGGDFGRHAGREAIRQFFSGAPEALPFAVHMVMNPIIEVDGDRAKGTWYFLGAFTLAKGDRAAWGSARYEDEYVKVNGEWLYQNLSVSFFFWTPFDEGWAKTRFVDVI